MLELIATISLMILAIHTCFQEGSVLGWLRIWCANQLDRLLGKVASRYLQKPLWDCMPCMASLWTVLITQSVDLYLILAVCGVNVVLERLTEKEEVCKS